MSKKLTSEEKKVKYRAALVFISTFSGSRVIKKFDDAYQIVIETNSGDVIDYYSSTETFRYRNKDVKGKGIEYLMKLILSDNLKYSQNEFLITKNKIPTAKSLGSGESITIHMPKTDDAKKVNSSFLERLAIKLLTKKGYTIIKKGE